MRGYVEKDKKGKIVLRDKDTGVVLEVFDDEKDLRNYLALDAVYNAKMQVIEQLYVFPDGLQVSDDGANIVIDDWHARMDEFKVWKKAIRDTSNTSEELYMKVNKKLEEMLQSTTDFRLGE